MEALNAEVSVALKIIYKMSSSRTILIVDRGFEEMIDSGIKASSAASKALLDSRAMLIVAWTFIFN